MTTYLDEAGDRFDPLSPELAHELWETLADMRERCPALRSEQHGGFVALTRYEDIQRAANDWRTYSSASGAAPVSFTNDDFRFVPLEVDPPLHRSVRALLNPFFLPKAVARFEPHMRAITNELIDGFAATGRCEFVADFAAQLPARVVTEAVLGVPREDLPQMLTWVHQLVTTPHLDPSVVDEYVAWVSSLMARRAGGERRGDVIDVLLHGQLDGRRLTDKERTQILTVLIVGSLDTTENALTNIMYHLASRPSLADWLGAADPETIDRAIEEFLRFESPVPAMSRTATTDTTVCGHSVRAGERVLLYYGSANRDPRHFEDPDELDFGRAKVDHMSFGWGIHSCIGRHLARLELRVAVGELTRRLRDIVLVPDQEISYRVAMSRSPEALHLVFTTTEDSAA